MKDIKKYEQTYLEHYGFEKYQVQYRRKKVLECLTNYQPQSILEVGCGLEPIFEFFDDYQQFHVVEPAPIFFESAREKAQGRPHIVVHHGFLEKLQAELAPEKFDMIIVSGLLHEFSEPVNFLQIINSLCKSHTIVHINVPNAQSIHRLLAVKMGITTSIFENSQLAQSLQIYKAYTLDTLVALVQKNSFEVLDKGTYFIKPFTHHQMEQMLTHKIIDMKVLDALYEATEFFPEFGSEVYINIRKTLQN